MNNRLKLLRETLNLSQDAFGDKIGITRSSISNIEKGTRNPSEQTLKSICREFNVNYMWLMEGVGDMFSDLPETIFEELAEEHDLDDLDKKILRSYLALPHDKRMIIKEYLQNIFLDQDK